MKRPRSGGAFSVWGRHAAVVGVNVAAVLVLGLLVGCSRADVKAFAEDIQRRAENIGAEQQASRAIAYPADSLEGAPTVVEAPGAQPAAKTGEEAAGTPGGASPPTVLLYAPPAQTPPVSP